MLAQVVTTAFYSFCVIWYGWRFWVVEVTSAPLAMFGIVVWVVVVGFCVQGLL